MSDPSVLGFKSLLYNFYNGKFVSPAFLEFGWKNNGYISSREVPQFNNDLGIYATYDCKEAAYYIKRHNFLNSEECFDGCVFIISGFDVVILHEHGFRAQTVLPIAVVESNFSKLGAWYFGIPEIKKKDAENIIKQMKKTVISINSESVIHDW